MLNTTREINNWDPQSSINEFYKSFKNLFEEAWNNQKFINTPNNLSMVKQKQLALKKFRDFLYVKIISKFILSPNNNLRNIRANKIDAIYATIIGNNLRNKIEIGQAIKDKISSLVEGYSFIGKSTSMLINLDEYFPENGVLEKIIPIDILGYMFESSLSLIQKRGKKGVFYTPKQIAHSMALKALYYYLICKKGLKIPKIDTDVDSIKAFENTSYSNPKLMLLSISSLSLNQLEEILKILNEIRICDNAAGCGSLLLMISQTLFSLKKQILLIIGEKKPSFKDYYSGSVSDDIKLKLYIIEHNIFGLDIEENALNMSKFRKWLWIHEIEDKNNFLYQDNAIVNINNIKYNLYEFDTLLQDLNEIHESDQSNLFGFDIIIGNPPYGQNKLKPAYRKSILEKWGMSYTIGSKKDGATYNPSSAFIERSHSQLKTGGLLVYIVNNSICRVDEFKKTRKFMLSNYKFLEVVDEGNPFDKSNVTLEMITFFLEKLPKYEKDYILDYNFNFISKRIDNYWSKIPSNLWWEFNRFILYSDSYFKIIYFQDSTKINVLHGTRGRDIEKSKKQSQTQNIPYLFSGRSLKKYKIIPKFVEYVSSKILEKETWNDEYNQEMLVTTKIGQEYRVMVKPKGVLIGNNVIKLKIDSSSTFNLKKYTLVALLNSKIMDYIVKNYIFNRSELTVAFYDSITMFTPIYYPLPKEIDSILATLGKIVIIHKNLQEFGIKILSESIDLIKTLIDGISTELYLEYDTTSPKSLIRIINEFLNTHNIQDMISDEYMSLFLQNIVDLLLKRKTIEIIIPSMKKLENTINTGLKDLLKNSNIHIAIKHVLNNPIFQIWAEEEV